MAPHPFAGVAKSVLNAFRTVRIQQFYGMTERSGACTCQVPERHSTSGPKAGKSLSLGQPTSSFEIHHRHEAVL